jgi:AAA+ ATPase superfamily predicted ATPase
VGLLTEFVTDPDPAMRLGIVSGRRRYGKSYLLQAPSERVGGLYVTAVREAGRLRAIQRFSDAIATQAGLRPGTLRLTDWREVLSNALDVTARLEMPLLVIDESPYLLQRSPEIPGLLQQLYDERRRRTRSGPGARVILCGSAMSVMRDVFSGTKPLRGRAVIDLRLEAFDYRAGRRFRQIDDPLTALQVHVVLGGAPGHRPAAARPHPNDGFASWLTRTLLAPGRAVYFAYGDGVPAA